MRFTANGPTIPSELLWARDQGRVVFFCGAGVSLARARLPDFFGLAEQVTKKLGVQQDSAVVRILNEAREIGRRTGVEGLISADRVFGLLERDFPVSEINAAVAWALKPGSDCDLSAHKTMVKLATTREGLVRLVTTNFDRLFDDCRPGLKSFRPPNLPIPSRPSDFNGIVYLHGKATDRYDGAEGDGFVLSSSEFGRAYLSDGWATSFFKEIIDRYSVVFVGYAADDPPVQYLLEALRKTAGKLEGVYAFQSGKVSDASAKWQHKGVEAIPYDSRDGHAALWATLEAWAGRAENPDGWVGRIIDSAMRGPEQLEPFQRGQVAHIIETAEGARRFAEAEIPPPATWLCVFDPLRRYERPGHAGRFDEKGPYVDPFDLFGLDSDFAPSKHGPDDLNSRREAPKEAWSAFELSKADRLGLQDQNVSSLRGHWAANAPRLPHRIEQLGVWISRVSDQPAAVWWAVRQVTLHPEVKRKIGWHLEQPSLPVHRSVRVAWRFLFDYWRHGNERSSLDWFELAHDIRKGGWDSTTVRTYARVAQPYIKVGPSYWGGPIPPMSEDNLETHELVQPDVEYPDLPDNVTVPDEWLGPVLVQLHRTLAIAVELETEIGGFGLHNIGPIAIDDASETDVYGRTHGLSGWMLYFVGLFKRLQQTTPRAAVSEFSRWQPNAPPVFSKLAIWACSDSSLVTVSSFAAVFNGLSDETFWDSSHARDLLITLKSRWNDLDSDIKAQIEKRIAEGPPQWPGEQSDHHSERRAASILNRLHWMHHNGCGLQLDLQAITERLQVEAPGWSGEHASSAAQSLEGRSGWVRVETQHSVLLTEPIAGILEKSLQSSGRKGLEFVEYDPFAGLVKERPVKAFASLRLEARRGRYPEWAWRTFLNPEHRKLDSPRFTAYLSCRLGRFSSEALSGIIRFVAEWCKLSAEKLAELRPELFARLVTAIVGALQTKPQQSESGIVRGGRTVDWTTEAINAPAGNLTEALFSDPQIRNLSGGSELPDKWRELAEQVLSLPDDLRRHALVIFGSKLNWLFWVAPEWTKHNILTALDSEHDEDRKAFWAGFLWAGEARGNKLFYVLKPHMLSLAKSGDLEKRGYTEVLAGLLLSAWGMIDGKTGEHWLSSDELRDVLLNSSDDFRRQILWQAKRWSSDNSSDDTQKWPPLVVELVRDVWPRQFAAKSPAVSAQLCDLAFSNKQRFPELAAAVLPLLTKIDGDHLTMPNVRSSEEVVDRHPELSLALLYAVLPEKAAKWPYGIEDIIKRIGDAKPELNSDERLVELRRIWNSR